MTAQPQDLRSVQLQKHQTRQPRSKILRYPGLDRLRGLAILLMVGDHLCVVLQSGELYRATGGRLAMPMFFLVAGALVRSPSSRWLLAAALGVALPAVVPWVDSPNVLLLYAVGACLLWLSQLAHLPSWVLVVPALVMLANGWSSPAGGFNASAALALMALGSACLPVATAGARLPAWLAWPGRRPLSLYVGHLLALQLLVLARVVG